jgi:hypothetical protein
MLRYAGAAVSAAALSISLAGCGGDPSPKPLPDPPSTSQTTLTPPAMPQAAKGSSKAAAAAFVRFWVRTLNYAGKTGDTAELREITSTGCSECMAIPGLIDKVYKAGGHIDGDGWRVDTATVVAHGGPRDLVFINAVIDVSPQQIFPSPSATPSPYTGANGRLKTFGVERKGNEWRLAQLDQKL